MIHPKVHVWVFYLTRVCEKKGMQKRILMATEMCFDMGSGECELYGWGVIKASQAPKSRQGERNGERYSLDGGKLNRILVSDRVRQRT